MMRLLLASCAGLLGAVSAEPLVPGYQRFPADEAPARAGALLYSELGCANCHGNSPVAVSRKGPSLLHLSSRVEYSWVEAFLQDPHATQPGSTMPQLTHELSGTERETLLAYLGSLGKPPKLTAPRHANAERGSALFHEKGCAACHAPTDDYRGPGGPIETIADWAVPLPDLKAKTGLLELQDFLTRTSAYRTDGRMPHFRMAPQDALDLAAHLLDYQSSDPRDAPRVQTWPAAGKEQVEAGRAIFHRQSCHACHDLPGTKPAPSIQLSGSFPKTNTPSCLDPEPQAGLPFYRLSKGQRESLLKFLSKDHGTPSPKDTADLTLLALNCHACHSRDGKGGPSPETDGFFAGEPSLGDSGRLPPPLTGIGHKLQEGWLTGVLKGDHRVRPYLETEMPTYPAHASALAALLAKADHQADAPPLTTRKEDLAAGHKLLGTNGGVNCVTCHNWGDKQSPGIPGPDLRDLDQRLRPEWFRGYLLQPADYRPGTLMPALWPKGRSTVPDILDGDTERQIASIWAYIEEGKAAPEGYVEKNGDYELIPRDRPIVQRAFFEKAGGRAILIGFPGGPHLAFNGDHGHPALIWRGRFFDAYETWFLRKAEFQKPLGVDAAEFEPPVMPIRFRGYELDEEGNPTFLLQHGTSRFTETYRAEDGRLVRRLEAQQGPLPAVAHPKGLRVDTNTGSPGKQTFTYSWPQ